MIQPYHFYPVQHAYNVSSPHYRQRYLCWSESWDKSRFMWLGVDHQRNHLWFEESESHESEDFPADKSEWPTHCLEVREPQPDTDLIIKKNFLKFGLSEVNMNTYSFGEKMFYRNSPTETSVLTNVTIRVYPEFKETYIEIYGNTRMNGSKTIYSGPVQAMSDIIKLLDKLDIKQGDQ